MDIKKVSQSGNIHKGLNSAAFDPREETELRRLIHAAFKRDPKRYAGDLGLSYEFINRVGDLKLPLRFSVRTLLPMLRISQDSAVISFLAKRLGFQIYRLPEPLRTVDVAQLLGDFIVTAAQAQRVAGEIIYRSGKEQKTELVRNLDWLIAISVTLRSALGKEIDG